MPTCGHGRGPGCYELYKNYYPTERDKIDASVSEIQNDITKIVEDLNALVIPEDYLGDKVKGQLKDICALLEADKDSIKVEDINIRNKIAGFIETHMIHETEYQSYRASLETEEEKSQQMKG